MFALPPRAMPAEVEAKLRADGPAPLSLLAFEPALARAALGRAPTLTALGRSLDRPCDRLAAALWACRLRSRGGAIRVALKGPAEIASGDWLHWRPEVGGPARESLDPGDWPPSGARACLDRLRQGEPLEERF